MDQWKEVVFWKEARQELVWMTIKKIVQRERLTRFMRIEPRSSSSSSSLFNDESAPYGLFIVR